LCGGSANECFSWKRPAELLNSETPRMLKNVQVLIDCWLH
jgi:hypothetical protein